MKAKPILIIFSILLLVTVVAIIVRSRTIAKPQQSEIVQFLKQFNANLQAGNTDSLLSDFEINKKQDVLVRLVNVLANKTGLKGSQPPIFKLVLDIDQSNIRILSSEFAEASIPVNFKNDTVGPKASVIKFKLHKISAQNYKIVKAEANKMMGDYLAFENLIKSKTLTDKDIYSPITLAAFETAKQLKTKYDSVIWFAHVNQKTYFYVVKGKWYKDQDIFHYEDSTKVEPYKMGLINPDLKEIIPVEYDLIHNISGTFPGLVEVEKGEKKGFYDLNGKIIVPVNYEQVFPIDDDANLAVLRNGDDYFYLKKDMSISEKTDIKVADFFPKLRKISKSFDLSDNAVSVITEYNSRESHGAIYIPPSYLSDLNLIDKVEDFKNPLRKVDFEEVSAGYDVDLSGSIKDDANWLQASFYSIRDYFLGGREEFYDKRSILVLDKKRNRIYGNDFSTDETPGGGDSLTGPCDINNIKQLNDTIFEVKTGAALYAQLYDSTKYISAGPYYHYMVVKNNKLVELPNHRSFGFTKYVKLDDTYLKSCYQMTIGTGVGVRGKVETLDHITPEMLRYMKNEIYADYAYKFKDKRWQSVFGDMPSYYDRVKGGEKIANVSVDDSLTVIDKYNLNWLNQKLNGAKSNTQLAK